MKKVILLALAIILLSVPCFAYFSNGAFNTDPFAQAEFATGPFNERSSTVISGGGGVNTWVEEDGNSDLQPLASGGAAGLFEEDGNGDLMPATSGTDTYLELDGSSDIMPKA